MKLYKDYTKESFSFLVKDTTFPSILRTLKQWITKSANTKLKATS